MKRIFLLIFLTIFSHTKAHASEWDLAIEINGKSNHKAEECGGVKCNENNNGYGLELRNYTRWPTIIGAGEFINSSGFDSWYVGAGKTLRFGNKYGAEIGVFGVYLSSPTRRGEHRLLAVMPIIVADFNYIRINTIYIPAYENSTYKTESVWFFQLAIPIRPR